MKVGDLVRYKHRYIGEQFVVVAIRPYPAIVKNNCAGTAKAKCVSVKTLKKTRWSCSSTMEVIA